MPATGVKSLLPFAHMLTGLILVSNSLDLQKTATAVVAWITGITDVVHQKLEQN